VIVTKHGVVYTHWIRIRNATSEIHWYLSTIQPTCNLRSGPPLLEPICCLRNEVQIWHTRCCHVLKHGVKCGCYIRGARGDGGIGYGPIFLEQLRRRIITGSCCVLLYMLKPETIWDVIFCEANMSVLQINTFLDRLHGDPIGFSVVGIFVIEKHTILTVRDVN